MGREKRKRMSLLSLGFRRSLSCSSSGNQKISPGLLTVPANTSSWFQAVLCSDWRTLQEKNNGQTHHWFGGAPTSCLFFFSNVPTNIDFSESSDSCSMYSVQVLQLYSVGETGWSALTPFYPEPEPKDFFRHMKLKKLITSRSSLQKKC